MNNAYANILQSLMVDSGSYKKIQITTTSFHLSGLDTLHSIEMPLGLCFWPSVRTKTVLTVVNVRVR